MVHVQHLDIDGFDGVLLILPPVYGDDRGYFSEVYSKAALARLGINFDPVQDNQSMSRQTGTVRGLHFQSHPFAQAKLVRVLQGTIFDVALDIRVGSPTYGKHASAVIDAKERKQLFIPKGFAHGFCTLEPNTEVLYKVDAPYAPDHDHGVLWSDADLGIAWPVATDDAVASTKDQKHPRLRNLPAYFEYADPDCRTDWSQILTPSTG